MEKTKTYELKAILYKKTVGVIILRRHLNKKVCRTLQVSCKVNPRHSHVGTSEQRHSEKLLLIPVGKNGDKIPKVRTSIGR